MRLIDHLKATGLSNRDARGAMISGKVWVGGIAMCDGGREVDPATVELRPNAPRIRVGRDLQVLWRDEHLAVVWKPSRMLAVPAPKREDTPNVLGETGGILGTVHAVHRLDEQTSGLMAVARTEEAQLAFKALLEAHDVERRYLAIVHRALPEATMTVDTQMVRNRGDGLRGAANEESTGPTKRAITHLTMVERLGPCSLVEARLETGRTHQVRIHLAEQRCPVLGDGLYGGKSVVRRAPRLALHAAVLAFTHPITGEAMRFEAPLADDLELLRRQLLAPREPRKTRGKKTRKLSKSQKKSRKAKKAKKAKKSAKRG